MTSLIPQQRLDKNGKLVTRHVRYEPKSSAASPQLPSPVLASSNSVQTPRETATDAWRRLESAGMKFSSAAIPNLEYVASNDPDLLGTMVARYTGTAGVSERALWQGMIAFTEMRPREGRDSEDDDRYLASYRSGLIIFGYVGRLEPYDPSGKATDYYRRTAQRFNLSSKLMPKSLDYQDPDAIKAVMLVMRVEELRGAAHWDDSRAVARLDHKRGDIEFLAENMDRVEPVLEGLLEMRATDSQAVEALWGTQSPLRGGTL